MQYANWIFPAFSGSYEIVLLRELDMGRCLAFLVSPPMVWYGVGCGLACVARDGGALELQLEK